MTLAKFLLKNLRYHARSHLAILLGCLIGSTVLTGALLVGDHLRGQLKQLNDWRLGAIQWALTSSRFFTSELATRLAQQEEFRQTQLVIVPIVQLRGTVVVRNADGQTVASLGSIQVLGVPPDFWRLFDSECPDLTGAVAINHALAQRLQLSVGSFLEIRLPRPSMIPQETFAGRSTDETGAAWQTTLVIESRPVRCIVAPKRGSLFSLAPQHQLPWTVYLPLEDVQRRLREPVSLANPANLVLVGHNPRESTLSLSALNKALQRSLSLQDFGLSLRLAGQPSRYLSLETNRLLLEDSLAEIACGVAAQLGWSARPTLTYLANLTWASLDFPGQLVLALGSSCCGWTPLQAALAWRSCYNYVPYMTVSVLDTTEDAPWGPFYNWDGQRWSRSVLPGEIVLTEFSANDLWPFGLWRIRLAAHQDLPDLFVNYFVESRGWLLEEKQARLRVAGVLAAQGAAVDPVLTPEFPGLRGISPRDWKPPFPQSQWHPEWIRQADEHHWHNHRAAPRAFVCLETAQQLGWISRHGKWTSIRIAPTSTQQPNQDSMSQFEQHLLRELHPEQLGFQWLALRQEAETALRQGAAGMFARLFLGFSLSLVISALLLITLLVRLQLLVRANEFGLLGALGFRPTLIAKLIIGELSIVLVLGCLLGLPTARTYAQWLLAWIAMRWPTPLTLPADVGASSTGSEVSYKPMLIGLLISLAAGYLAVLWGMRKLRGQSPRQLLVSQSKGEQLEPIFVIRPMLTALLIFSPLAGALLSLALAMVSPTSQAPVWFFTTGGFLLLAGLTITSRYISHVRRNIAKRPWWLALGLRLAAQQRRRNLLTISLLAVATFLLSAVEVFYKTPPHDPFVKNSGTGGFPLLAESDIPLPFIPGSLSDWQALVPDASVDELNALVATLAREQVKIYGFRVRPGEDVSCLNLYQPRRPKLLGVPADFLERGGFAFRSFLPTQAVHDSNPWSLLTSQKFPAVPTFADAQTAEWVLHIHLGETFPYPGDSSTEVPLYLTALLNDSIFQGALLISESNFTRHFPHHPGYAFFLIETKPSASAALLAQRLESALGERFGFTTRQTLEILATYHQVENLYLQTFQILGSFGLLLGVCGVAVVLLRNVQERRAELALLQAIGYTGAMLGILVLVENGLLVVLGLGIGLLAAITSISPHWYLTGAIGATVYRLAWILAGMLTAGLVAGSIALYSVVRLPILTILRRE